MRKSWIVLGVAAALGLGCSHMHMTDKEDEEKNEVKMTLDQVPQPVRDTLTREAAGAEIDRVDKEMSNGKTVYETDVKSGGQNREIKVDENGKLISNKVEKDEDEEKEEHK